jgi:hypothetical protein
MQEGVRATNQKLSLLNSKTRIVNWFHGTGNFVVQASDNNRLRVADELSLALGTPCAILTVEELIAVIDIAKKAISPLAEPGFRWTRGIGFWVSGRPCTITLQPTNRAVFFPINKHAVGAFKKDRLVEGKETLDKENRGGGWGAISADIAKATGGIWTSRSLERVDGTLAKAQSQQTGTVSKPKSP